MPDLDVFHCGRRTAADDYRDALARLLAGDPQDRELRKKAERGKLRINISSVAREARRARSPIAIDDPKSPFHNVRREILKAAGTAPAARSAKKGRLTLQAVVTNLRGNLKRLEKERDLAAQRATDAVAAARDCEKRAWSAETALRNLRREMDGRPPRDAPIPAKPKGPPPDNILKFPRDR